MDALGSVAGVDDQLCLVDDGFVVVAAVVGDDEDRVVLAEVVKRRAAHVQGVMTSGSHGGE